VSVIGLLPDDRVRAEPGQRPATTPDAWKKENGPDIDCGRFLLTLRGLAREVKNANPDNPVSLGRPDIRRLWDGR
jgi:hypothetical protein